MTRLTNLLRWSQTTTYKKKTRTPTTKQSSFESMIKVLTCQTMTAMKSKSRIWMFRKAVPAIRIPIQKVN